MRRFKSGCLYMKAEQQKTVDMYEQTMVEICMDNIRQQLLFYDNLPEDDEIVRLVKKWNVLYHRSSELEYILTENR